MLLHQGLSRRRALTATGLGLLASGGHAWAAEGEEARLLQAAGAEPGRGPCAGRVPPSPGCRRTSAGRRTTR
jgi:hypothetical protein